MPAGSVHVEVPWVPRKVLPAADPTPSYQDAITLQWTDLVPARFRERLSRLSSWDREGHLVQQLNSLSESAMQAEVRKRVQQVMKAMMKEENAVAFFNEPVDAEGLGLAQDYREVVKVPMDLGTAFQKLESGQYSEPLGLLRDVSLIWRNCRAFNMPGSDVFNACDQLEGAFDRLWRKNRLDRLTGGLVSSVLSSEARHPLLEGRGSLPAASGPKGPGSKGAAAAIRSSNARETSKKNVQLSSMRALPMDHNALRNGHPLQRCLNVVTYLLTHPDAEPFAAPVDVRTYVDYPQHVRQPMDLGTIRGRLAPGASQGWGTIAYKSTGEVLADVRLVWRNCRAYNAPGDPITDACQDLETLFEKAWTEAGLGLEGATPAGAGELQPRGLYGAQSPRVQAAGGTLGPAPASPSMRRKAAADSLAGPQGSKPHAVVHPGSSNVRIVMNQQDHIGGTASARREAKPVDSDPDYLGQNDSGSDSESRHSMSGDSDSAGSWQPRAKGAKRRRGLLSSSSGGGVSSSRCDACVKAKRGRCGTVHAGSNCMRRKQQQSYPPEAGPAPGRQSSGLQGDTQGQGLPKGLGQLAGLPPDAQAAAVQRHTYAVARQRAEAAAAAQAPTDAEKAALLDYARLQQFRQRAVTAQRNAEAALEELAHARQVLRQVEAAEAAKAKAHVKAAELEKQEWPSGSRLTVSGHDSAQQQQHQPQQQPRGLHPEVNALAQQWLSWDSPVLQSSVDSATTNQRANPTPTA